LADLLQGTFRLPSFRPYQEAVCRAVTAGEDVLLVMPTGAGKSLCYQLPGQARGGTTLVVSPLIALMEDQVAKLKALGLRASRIHSGRDRAESREVGQDYLAGRLDFLFVAPERLRVPGFAEMRPAASRRWWRRRGPLHLGMGARLPSDYRLLGDACPCGPVIALTATATPRVRTTSRLRRPRPRPSVHPRLPAHEHRDRSGPESGWGAERRRGALGPRPARRRPRLRSHPQGGRRPGHGLLGAGAGSRVSRGHNTQPATGSAAFLSGELEVIVATIAFGMGVDKPDACARSCTGLPGSLELLPESAARAALGNPREPSSFAAVRRPPHPRLLSRARLPEPRFWTRSSGP
jgi:hypothetical protein